MATVPAELRPGLADPEVSVVIPCLNEAENIGECVRIAQAVLDEHGLDGEVIVVDNGSDDGSGAIGRAAGAHVVEEPARGYGNAYLAGLAIARGRYVVMGDADLSYDFREIPRFIDELRSGADLVLGNRMGDVRPGAMPWMNRYIGNPVMTRLLNRLFRLEIGDAWCGMRALRRDILPRLALRTSGMEFALEMVMRAAKQGLAIREIPITLHPRGGTSKLSPYRDGWRALRFMLVHSPTYLFMLPGAAMMALGALIAILVLSQIPFLGREWYVHALIGGCLLAVLGSQVIALGVCARAYGVYVLGESDVVFERLARRLRLEHGLLAGGLVGLGGTAAGVVVIGIWASRGFGHLAEERLALLAATLAILGIQIFFTSLLVSILALGRPGD